MLNSYFSKNLLINTSSFSRWLTLTLGHWVAPTSTLILADQASRGSHSLKNLLINTFFFQVVHGDSWSLGSRYLENNSGQINPNYWQINPKGDHIPVILGRSTHHIILGRSTHHIPAKIY